MRVLVTGATSWEGARLIESLSHRDETTVIAVDDVDRRSLPVPLHRSDLDTLEFAHFVVDVQPTVIMHLATADRSREVGGQRSREAVILGTQALMGAIARLPHLGHIVLRSEGTVYGAGNRVPLIAKETTRLSGQASRHARALREAERYTEDAAREVGVPVAVLRAAESVTTHADAPLAHLMRLPLLPVMLGFDPLLQLLHEDDLRSAYLHALDHRLDGVFNVAPATPLYLSQVCRLAGIRTQRLPKPQLEAAYRLLARGGLPVPGHTRSLLRHGRVLDTGTLRDAGFTPGVTTRQIATSLGDPR